MKNEINISLLDNDVYKFSMQYPVIKLFPDAIVRYQFINRGKHKFHPKMKSMLENVIDRASQVSLTSDEIDFIEKKIYWLGNKKFYLDFLKSYKYNPNEVKIIQSGDDLHIDIEGYWYTSILWEVPLMSWISELNYQLQDKKYTKNDINNINKLMMYKADNLKKLNVKFSDFGTRRRYSFLYHDQILNYLYKLNNFIGTSNMFFAKKYNINPIGTQAHEWYMYHAAKYGFTMSTLYALENWSNIYRGDLGVALTDTFTTNCFLKSFDKYYAKLFDGVRQDSGSPFDFVDKIIDYYIQLKINPQHKTIVFSNALNYNQIVEIEKYVNKRINTAYGIGTWLTNDTIKENPLNIVIKMTEVYQNSEWIPTVKLSDDVEKNTGNINTINLAKNILRLNGGV